jgi:hypothetical protein
MTNLLNLIWLNRYEIFTDAGLICGALAGILQLCGLTKASKVFGTFGTDIARIMRWIGGSRTAKALAAKVV